MHLYDTKHFIHNTDDIDNYGAEYFGAIKRKFNSLLQLNLKMSIEIQFGFAMREAKRENQTKSQGIKLVQAQRLEKE